MELKTGNSLQPELIIKLTDEDDPFFLYELHLNAEDFKNLKEQQSVLIEFNAFPACLIDYLKSCIRDQNTHTASTTGSRFQLQLVTEQGKSFNEETHLRVIEISKFKHLTHISLLVTPANDYEIKNYLARRLQSKTTDYQQLSSDYEKLKRELELTQLEFKDKNTEFDKLKLEWDSKTNELVGTYMKKLADEKERALTERSNMQDKMERDRRELEQNHLQSTRDMQERLNELEKSTKELTTLKYRNEIQINELDSKYKTLVEEHQQSKDEIAKFKQTIVSLENELHQSVKTAGHLRTKIALVEQEVKSKQEVLQQTNDRIAMEQDSKKKYEETVQLKMEKMSELKRDLVKGNEIIVRFGNDIEKYKRDLEKSQNELAKSREKMKTKDQIATKQERILQEKERELANLQKERDDFRQQIERSNEIYKKLLDQHNEATECLKKNETLINYLNHKLTELQSLQSQQGRLTNGNLTLDTSSSITTNNQFRPSSFLNHSHPNGDSHSIRHVAQFPSLQTHYEPMNKTPGTTWNSSTTGHHQNIMTSTQMPISSSVLNNSTIRQQSASNGDLKEATEASSKIDPKYFQFNSSSSNIQPLRSSTSAGNVQNILRTNSAATGSSSLTNKPLSAQQNRSARQHSVHTTPLASAYSSEKQM